MLLPNYDAKKWGKILSEAFMQASVYIVNAWITIAVEFHKIYPQLDLLKVSAKVWAQKNLEISWSSFWGKS